MVVFGRGNIVRVPGTMAAPPKPTPLVLPSFWRLTERGEHAHSWCCWWLDTPLFSPDSQLWLAVFKASRPTGRILVLTPRSLNTFIMRSTLTTIVLVDDGHYLIILLCASSLPFPSPSPPLPSPPHTQPEWYLMDFAPLLGVYFIVFLYISFSVGKLYFIVFLYISFSVGKLYFTFIEVDTSLFLA